MRLARESHRFVSAPAVAVYDDAGALFFFGREVAIVVRIEEAQNFLMGLFTVMVFKNLDVNWCRVFFAEARGKQDAAVDGICVADEAANEANDNRWR